MCLFEDSVGTAQ